MIYTVDGKDYEINKNLVKLVQDYKAGKAGTILEGSSRSAKTTSSVDFIIYICSKLFEHATINIIKETSVSFKTTLYDDFNRRLPQYGISSPFADREQVNHFRLFTNRINLLGADDDSKFHGASCDFAYFNEMLDIPQKVFDQVEQRCRKFWWGDYNPKTTTHWVFDRVCKRSDVGFLHTTFDDNPYCSPNERAKILSYQPIGSTAIAIKFGSNELEENAKLLAIHKAKKYDAKHNPLKFELYHLEELERAIKNEDQGTADDYLWNVYGLGLRSAPSGLIFQHVNWLKEFPTDVDAIYFGSDLGYTNSPSTLVKVGVQRKAKKIFCQKLFYQPTPSSEVLIPLLQEHLVYKRKVDNVTKVKKFPCWMDCADPLGMIAECRRAGLEVYPVKKYAGSIKHGIALMKKYKIYLIDSPEWRAEQGGYVFKEVNGIKLDEPADGQNHLWDAARYAVMSNLIE